MLTAFILNWIFSRLKSSLTNLIFRCQNRVDMFYFCIKPPLHSKLLFKHRFYHVFFSPDTRRRTTATCMTGSESIGAQYGLKCVTRTRTSTDPNNILLKYQFLRYVKKRKLHKMWKSMFRFISSEETYRKN